MTSRGPNEAKLERVFYPFNPHLTAQAGEANAVIDLLSAVLVADIQDDLLLPAIE